MKITGTLLLLLFYPTIQSLGQKFVFEYHEIGSFGNRMGQTSLVDVDNDGDLDWVFGQSGNLYWWEYTSPTEWKLHEIGRGAKTDVGGCPLDVNNDGWIDFVVGDSWYENTGNPRNEKFIWHKKNMIGAHDNIAVDMDGDGIKDIVSLSNNPDHPVLAWYKIPKDHTLNWDYTKIGDGIHGGIGPKGFGDLKNNGHIDIVRGNIWFEHLDGEGQKWKRHETLTPPGGSRPDKFGLALKTWVLDLDDDGDPDIVQAEADTPNGRVFWWENVNNAGSFNYHPISADSTGQDFHSLAIADFDDDGDMDILSGGGPLTPGTTKLYIWENLTGNGKKWKEHEILSGNQIHEAVVADIDGDGDIDIFSKPWRGDLHIFLENKMVE